jgi:hypothetical protein
MHSEIAIATPRFFGPWAVRAAFVLAIFGWGIGFYGPSIYLAEVISRTGWRLSMVSAAVTVHFLFGALVVANLPRVYARIGLPVTTIIGAVVTALGVFGWAIASQPWQLFAAALASGMGWVTMGAVAVNTIVSRWYVVDRPSALAKAYNGASIGGVIFSPLWVALIGWLGFAGAASAVGVTMVAVAIALSWGVFSKIPENLGQMMDGNPARQTTARRPIGNQMELPGRLLWQDRAFITLAAGMAAGLFSQIGLIEHLFKLLTPALGAQASGILMGGGTACAIAGRAVAARAVMHVGDRHLVAAASYAVQALGALALLLAHADQVWLMVLGVALFGAGIGNATSLPPLIAQADFAAKDVSRVVALIVAMGQGTYAFAPAFFGLLLSACGSSGHEPSIGHHSGLLFATAICIQLGAGTIFLLGQRSR